MMSSDMSNAQPPVDAVKTSKLSLEARLHTSSKSRPATTEDRLSKLYKRESDIIGELKITLDALKEIMFRVRTEGVKTSKASRN